MNKASGSGLESFERWAGIAGVCFAVLLITQFIIVGTLPHANASSDSITQFVMTHRDKGLLAAYLIGLAIVLFLWFASTLRMELGQRAEGASLLADIGFAGALAGLTVQLLLTGVQATFLYLAPGDASITHYLYAVTVVGGNISGFAFAAFLGFSGAEILRHHAFPAWVGWLAMLGAAGELLAAGSFAQSGAFAATGPLAFIGGLAIFLLFVLVVSVMFIMRGRTHAAPVATPLPA